MRCAICGGCSAAVFRAKILRRHDVQYYQCAGCGWLHTEDAYWLDEAYAAPIAALDTGLVARNIAMASRLASLLFFALGDRGRAPWLDAAGGTGMLVRLMRDRGFDFRWSDRYAENLFARGFEHQTGVRCAGVTAIEVMEHLEDPVEFCSRALAESGAELLVFSTELYEGAPPPPGWWYYAFDGGQHISFYQRATLDALAWRLGLRCTSGGGLHCLGRKPPSAPLLKLLSGALRYALAPAVRLILGSRTMPDHLALAARGVQDAQNSSGDTART